MEDVEHPPSSTDPEMLQILQTIRNRPFKPEDSKKKRTTRLSELKMAFEKGATKHMFDYERFNEFIYSMRQRNGELYKPEGVKMYLQGICLVFN